MDIDRLIYKRKQQIQEARNKKVLNQREIQRLQSFFTEICATAAAFMDVLENPDQLEQEKKARKSRAPTTIGGWAKKEIGTSAVTLEYQPMSRHESELFLVTLAKHEKVVPIDLKSVYHLDEEKLIKRRYGFGRRRVGPDGDKEDVIFGAVRDEGDGMPPVMLVLARGEQSTGVALFYPSSATEDEVTNLLEWFRQVRREHSPFHGIITRVDDDQLGSLSNARRVSWDEIIPVPEVRQEIEKCIAMMSSPSTIRGSGLAVRRGLIFAGPPGVGKTMHLEAMINEVLDLDLPVFMIGSCAATTLATIYRIAQDVGPSLVVFEDIDTLFISRDEFDSPQGGNSMLSALLAVLDGAEERDGVITVATTNAPGSLDRAIAARPGRFDRIYRFGYPSPDERKRVLRLYAEKHEFMVDPVEVLDDWVLHEDGITPSHLASIVQTAKRDRILGELDEASNLQAAAEAIRSTLNTDHRFVEKKPVGFE